MDKMPENRLRKHVPPGEPGRVTLQNVTIVGDPAGVIFPSIPDGEHLLIRNMTFYSPAERT